MEIKKTFLAVFFGTLFLFSVHPVFAQESTLAQLQTDLVSPWLVTIKGQARTLILRITAAKHRNDEAFALDATYGFIDGRQDAVEAEVMQTAKERKLRFNTQSGNRYAVTQTPSGLFEGTYTGSKGNTKEVSMERLSEDELKQRMASYQAGRTAKIIVEPGSDVPKECAAFSGRWTGSWPVYGQTWLWVVEVAANCVAKCMSWTTSAVPNRFQSCDIKNNVLMREKPDGMEYYELRGDELWARYVYTGGQNGAVFRKLTPGEK
ncbi:MAG: hypothetical protein M0P95_04920 [Sulfuritalea sp.]|jgi:hypothetical protein|nr:hypothetical protein [Sulfuritalea sp.]